MRHEQTVSMHGIGIWMILQKPYCTDLKELKYDYDLERVAMKRAAEIALSYDHERPIGRVCLGHLCARKY